MEQPTVEARVRTLIERLLGSGPIYVVDFCVRGAKGSQAVDLFVESDHALGAATLADLSREVGFLLDSEDVLPGAYTLTVSTPGADRPLRLPRQYRKHVGRTLRVHYRQPSGQCTEICGTLAHATQQAIRIEMGGRVSDIMFSDIEWAKVQLPW